MPPSAVQGLPLSQYSTSSFSNPSVAPAYGAISGQIASGYGAVSQQLGSQLGALRDNAMQSTADFGATDRQRIQDAYQKQIGQQRQAATSSGLGNNTILSSLQTGSLQNEQLNLTANSEAANRNRLSAMGQFGLPAIQGPAEVKLAGLNAQQQLGQQYLGILSKMGTQSNAVYQRMAGSGGGGGGGGGGKIPQLPQRVYAGMAANSITPGAGTAEANNAEVQAAQLNALAGNSPDPIRTMKNYNGFGATSSIPAAGSAEDSILAEQNAQLQVIAAQHGGSGGGGGGGGPNWGGGGGGGGGGFNSGSPSGGGGFGPVNQWLGPSQGYAGGGFYPGMSSWGGAPDFSSAYGWGASGTAAGYQGESGMPWLGATGFGDPYGFNYNQGQFGSPPSSSYGGFGQSDLYGGGFGGTDGSNDPFGKSSGLFGSPGGGGGGEGGGGGGGGGGGEGG